MSQIESDRNLKIHFGAAMSNSGVFAKSRLERLSGGNDYRRNLRAVPPVRFGMG